MFLWNNSTTVVTLDFNVMQNIKELRKSLVTTVTMDTHDTMGATEVKGKLCLTRLSE